MTSLAFLVPLPAGVRWVQGGSPASKEAFAELKSRAHIAPHEHIYTLQAHECIDIFGYLAQGHFWGLAFDTRVGEGGDGLVGEAQLSQVEEPSS